MADHRPTTTPATASSDASDLDNGTDDAPLYDGPSFEELGVPAALAQVLADAGIHNPFPIQAATLPDSLAGRDVLGRGRTGSGKTLAFALPLVTRLAADGVRAADRKAGRKRAPSSWRRPVNSSPRSTKPSCR